MIDNETNFSINCIGEVTGENFIGDFKIKIRLSHRDTVRQAQFMRELGVGRGSILEENPDLRVTAATAEIFAKIWVHTIKAPNWWVSADNGMSLIDEKPVTEVYKKIVELERKFNEDLAAKAEKAKEDLKAIVG